MHTDTWRAAAGVPSGVHKSKGTSKQTTNTMLMFRAWTLYKIATYLVTVLQLNTVVKQEPFDPCYSMDSENL